jgi:hypothetical protein
MCERHPFCDQCKCEHCVTGAYREFRVRSALDATWWCDVCYLDDMMATGAGPRPPWVVLQETFCDQCKCEHCVTGAIVELPNRKDQL